MIWKESFYEILCLITLILLNLNKHIQFFVVLSDQVREKIDEVQILQARLKGLGRGKSDLTQDLTHFPFLQCFINVLVNVKGLVN